MAAICWCPCQEVANSCKILQPPPQAPQQACKHQGCFQRKSATLQTLFCHAAAGRFLAVLARLVLEVYLPLATRSVSTWHPSFSGTCLSSSCARKPEDLSCAKFMCPTEQRPVCRFKRSGEKPCCNWRTFLHVTMSFWSASSEAIVRPAR